MVKFSVFNELSLPISNENLFGIFFQILERLRELGLHKIRMDKEFSQYPEILPLTTLEQFFGQLQDRDKKTRLLSFINNRISIIESPLIQEHEEESEKLLENEYFYNYHSTTGALACAEIWNTVVVSFQSNSEWNTPFITIEKHTLLEKIQQQSCQVRNISDIPHLNDHQDFFDALEQCIRLDIKPSNFWEKKVELFNNKIIFCDEIEKQIKNIDTSIFAQAVSILRDIENGVKDLSDFNISGESQSVRQNTELKKLREFEVDGKKEYFQKHIKNLSNGYRIHFFEKGDKIYIGYIGKHLETAKF